MAASAEASSGPEIGEHLLTEPAPVGMGRLRQYMAYAKKVFDLDSLLGGIRDRRHDPDVSIALVARIIFVTGLLRIRSFNALEPKLAEPALQRALGARVNPDARICSVDTLGYALARADVQSARNQVVKVIQKAERNKVFREGWHGALRFVAIDGWEPLSSYSRCCTGCLTRQVKVKGSEETVTQYYHAFVVAMLIDERLDLVVDMEPIRSADVRADAGEANIQGHEGELTAGKRLLARMRSTYGRWIDAVVVDALYANGPFLTLAKQCGMGVVVVLKKDNNEPLQEALSIWKDKPPDKIIDNGKGEHIDLWDCPGIETLSTYDGPIRVVRGVVHRKRPDGKDETVGSWSLGVIGCATRLAPESVLGIGRGRWHIENTAFHQFVTRWRFNHVFKHGPDAIPTLYWIFFLAFNLLQLFLYRKLCSYGRDRGKDVTRTISRLIDEMNDDLARLDKHIAWDSS